MRFKLSILKAKSVLLQGCTGLLLLGAGCSSAQTAVGVEAEAEVPSGVQRAHLQRQRQALEQALRQAETACYQRFAVEDCLRQERQKARKAQVDLRQQETAIDTAQRRERAAQRLSEMAERERTRPVPAPVAPRAPSLPPAPAQEAPRAAAEDAAAAARLNAATRAAERKQQARERASQQQQKRKAHQTNQAQAVSAQAAQAAKARQQREEKNAAAAQRRARVLQSQAEAAAAGRTPAAPLSPNP